MASGGRPDTTPTWLRHVEFFVVMAVLAFARPDPFVTVALTFVALAVVDWRGPWPTWLRDRDPPVDNFQDHER